MKFKELVKSLDACKEGVEWLGDRTFKEFYEDCPRGDWMLWLFKKVNPDDLQLLTLAKGHCANTVRHLMTDERSLKAVDTAIAFGEGKATRQELDKAAITAYAGADAAYAGADAWVAAWAAGWAAAAAADAAYAADAAAYAAAVVDAADAREQNQRQTADICRKYLPIEIWNIKEVL
jgi:hypothetical protein